MLPKDTHTQQLLRLPPYYFSAIPGFTPIASLPGGLPKKEKAPEIDKEQQKNPNDPHLAPLILCGACTPWSGQMLQLTANPGDTTKVVMFSPQYGKSEEHQIAPSAEYTLHREGAIIRPGKRLPTCSTGKLKKTQHCLYPRHFSVQEGNQPLTHLKKNFH